jgi:TP901 family phage tail tape measure protein
MADVNATFVYDADFTSAISQTRLLSRELSTLNNSFNSLDKDARKVRDRLGEIFKADVGDLGAFSARTVDITSNMDNFGKALDRNKLKLRDYAREARKAFQADSNSRKLAEDQVRRSKASLVEMGMDASGRRKGILVTPLKLDMSDMQTQLEVSRKQFSIFNKLVNDGATQLINWGKNTQWAGRQLTVGLTVPMTIFATTTIKAFNEVDKELTRFQKVYGSDLVGATTQATNAIRQQVQALAVDIAGAYGVAAKETAGLAADLAATGLEGQKLLDSIKQTTRLSVLGEIDRQDAMKTTLSLQNAFNMSTQELAESINFLNAVENQTSLSLQDLTEAIPKVGPVVRALGGDVKDLSVLMVAMKEGGINAAEGANALKSGLASLINPTKAGSEVAKQYGIDLEDIVKRNKGQLLPTVLEFQKSMQTLDDLGKAKIIEQLFGKYQFARISALFDNLNTQGSQTKQVIELMSASNTDLARIANAEIKTLTESASMRFQRSMEAIKAALLPVGEAIVNSVLPFMERFAGVLDRIVSFAQNLPGPIKSFLKIAGGLTAIAGPLIMMTGVLGNFLGYIVKGAMAFVNLGRTIRGLPVEKFSLMDDAQIAASKATDTVTISIEKQKSAMIGLNKLMMDYYTLINKQAARTPNLFNSTPQSSTIGGSPVVPKGVRTLPIIRRQSGGAAYVPGTGSGDKIPALLEPGEFVINREATKQYGGLLEDINNGTPRFQSGGKMPRKIPVPGYMSGFTGRRMAAYNARYNNNLPARQPVQQPNPGGQPLRYGNEAEWERNFPVPYSPDGISYSNITYRRQFQARQANEQISVIMSRLRNANNSQELVDSIPEIIRNVQIAKSIRIREEGETKPFPADSTFPMPKPLNTVYNDLIPGKSSDTSTFRSILTKIADSSQLTLEQKKSLFTLVSRGDAPADPELVSFMSTAFRGILDEGLPSNFSKSVAAKMALSATSPAEFRVPLKPMSSKLGEGFIGQSTNRSITGLENTDMWRTASRELGLESLPLAAQSTANTNAAKLLAKSLSISEEDAMTLIRAQNIGEFHVSHAQSGGVIKAMRGVKMPESYATKLATIRQSMANANKEAMSSNVPLTELGTRQSRIGGYSSAIPGVNGVYEINGQRYVVKGHDTYESAKAEADMARITREVFGLQTPNQEAVRIRHPETGELMFAVRSPYNEAFAKTTGRFTEDSAFDQLIASIARRDKDLQADNLFDNIVTDVGQAGIMSKASQPRIKTGPTNSALEQLAINLGMNKGGARSHGAEAWNAATANMTDAQIISRIKEAAAKAKSKLSTSDIPEDFKYIAKDLDDIASADLGPFVAHLRTVFPKEKKPATAAAIAKKEQQKLLDREERQSALDAGYPAWAMQSGGVIRAQNGGLIRAMFGMRIPRSKKNTPYSGEVASSLTPKVSQKDQDLLDLYFDKPQVGHLDNLHKTPLGEIAGRGMVPSQTLYRGMSDFDMNLVKQSGTLTRDSVMSTTRDRDAAIKIASGLSDSGGGNTYSVAKIKVGRGTRGVHLNSLVPRARQSLDEILLSPQTPLHFRRSEIGYRINTGESIIPIMQHVFSTKKPNMIQRLYDRILQSRQSELRPLTRDEVRYWQQAGAPLTEGMQLVANKGKTIYGDSYEENYQRSQSIKRVEEAAAAERARKALLTPEESRAEYLASVAAREARNDRGVQTGGIIRAQEGMNTSAWVPGKGEGDRVPALLEPGEFVVNKKAAKQYGGMLEELNWNVAPRFMRGTPPVGQMPGMTTGAVSGGLMAASMATSMMLPVNQFTDALNKSIMALSAFTGILSALQMLGGRMGGGIGEKLSGVMTAKDGSKAARFKRSGDLYSAFGKDSIKTGGSNLKSVVGKGMSMGSRGTALKTGIGAVARGGAMLGMGSAFGGLGAGAALATNPVGWAILAIGAATLAITKYKKSLDSAKKSAEQAFGASKAEAEAFGVELKSIGETIKANQEYTKMIGAQAQQSQSTSQRLDPEKESALLGANEDLTKRLRNLSETRLATTVGLGGDRSAQAASLLTSKYASLIQQGFSEEDANVMVRTLAKASGAMDAYAQSVNKFGMIKADDPASIIKAQMEGVKTFSNIGGLLDQGERGGFAAGIKSVVEQINLLPPEDQYTGLKTLLTQMENLDTRQLKIAQQAIVDMTKENYGEGSQLFNTQRAIQERTNNSFSFKNLSTYDDVFAKIRGGQGLFGGIENELATRVSAALTSAFETGAITDQQLKDYELRIEADPSSISQIEAELDAVTRDRQIKIEATIKLEEQLAEQYEKINKEIIIKQNALQSAIEAKNAAIEKEEEAFKASQKAGQKFIKGKQEEIKVIDEKATKEIEAIEKQTDTYLKSLTKQDDANKFRAEQRGTMLGGLGALAEGDVFGFLDARQAAEENARQFSASEEIKVIEEKRKAATEAIDLERDARIEAIQAEIDKKQEALERQAEGHEAHMARLQKERDTMATNASKTISEMQATADSIAGIKANPVILDWLTSMKDKGKAAAAQAALINYLVKHPEATVTEALNKVRSDLHQSDQSFQAGMNSNEGERAGGAGSGGQYTQTYTPTPTPTTSAGSSGMTGGRSGRAPGYTVTQASGGYISGPGTSTSDSIPARLSDGEYVIKASAVDQYGVGMMNSINEQKFADGGQAVLDDYSRVTYGGKTFNARTVRMLKRAEESYGSGFGFYQGSYSTGISASKGTHDGGGAVDIKPPANIDKALKALASAGFWAKWRGTMSPPHIHALATGDAQLSSAARRQLGLPADGGYEGDQIEVGTRSVEDAIKEAAAAGQGTIQELTSLMAEGAAAVYTPLTGRQFGGSMTMNKPYLVGENGPEVVMPYGSGSRVDPRFNVPSGSSIATVSQDYGDIINSNSYSNMVVNLSVSGVNDPNKAADRVIEILNRETGRRNHSRKMSR